jgi:2-methylfumaryl-CoA isomerase
MMLALAGVRIIESAAFIAAPLAGLTLAQYGAEVIRIDPIGGGIDYNRMPRMPQGRSLYWTGLNKGKRSLALDIRSPEGRELAAALVTGCGALLTNIGVPWLAHDLLAQGRPDLVTCVIEGNPDGSQAVDYTVNCATGYPMMTGQCGAPVNHALPAWDVACALQASTAVVAALMRRQAAGIGAALRIALSDVAFATLSHLGLLAEAELLCQDRPAIGNDIYGAFGRDFVTLDGRRIMVAAILARQWAALVAACGMAETVQGLERMTGLDFRDEASRFQARDLLAAIFDLWIKARPLAEVATAFTAQGVAWGEYRSLTQGLANDPRLSPQNRLFSQITTQGVGAHLAAGPVARGMAAQPARPAPVLGEDTDQVLAEVLGLSDAAIGALHDRGIVAGPNADPLMRHADVA